MPDGARPRITIDGASAAALVAFYGGDPRRPVVIGALWNGADRPPEVVDATNDRRSITSRAGHTLRFDDSSDGGRVELRTANGMELTLDDRSRTVTVRATSRLHLDAPEIRVDAGTVTFNPGVASFAGRITADSVVANSVVASTYTNGAGNIW